MSMNEYYFNLSSSCCMNTMINTKYKYTAFERENINKQNISVDKNTFLGTKA